MQVRETESLNKTGVLKHVKDIILKIRKITDRLAKVNTLPGQNPGTIKEKRMFYVVYNKFFTSVFSSKFRFLAYISYLFVV